MDLPGSYQGKRLQPVAGAQAKGFLMDIDRKIEDLILLGAVEVSGIDSRTGEFLYSFTEKIHDIDPELARESQEIFNKYLYYLWEKGFLKINMESENPVVSLLPKCFIQEEVSILPNDSKEVLRYVMEALRL
jgi:hypothetical protein